MSNDNSTIVVLTSGEYSEYSLDRILGVPSMDWLRERMIEYKEMMGRWMEGGGGYKLDLGDGFLFFENENGYVDRREFDEWLVVKYGSEIEQSTGVEVVHVDD